MNAHFFFISADNSDYTLSFGYGEASSAGVGGGFPDGSNEKWRAFLVLYAEEVCMGVGRKPGRSIGRTATMMTTTTMMTTIWGAEESPTATGPSVPQPSRQCNT
jgi:hypothetical protein